MTNFRNEPARASDFIPDPDAMKAFNEHKARCEASGIASKPQPGSRAVVRDAKPKQRYEYIVGSGRWIDIDDPGLQQTKPPPDNEERLAEIRARHQAIVAQREAEAAAADAEKNRVQRLEARVAELEAERAEPTE